MQGEDWRAGRGGSVALLMYSRMTTLSEIRLQIDESQKYWRAGRFDEAERLVVQSLQHLDELEKAREKNNGDSAQELVNGADAPDNDGLCSIRTQCLSVQGTAALQRGDSATALDVFEKLLSLAKSSGDSKTMARALNGLGDAYGSEGQNARAFEKHEQALHIQTERNDTLGIAATTNSMGSILQNLGDFAQALSYYTKALQIYEECADKGGAARVAGNIGGVHNQLGDYALALEFNSRALSLCEEIDDIKGIARELGKIGLIHVSLGDHAKAYEYHVRALAICEDLGDQRGIALHSNHAGNACLGLSDYPKALEWYAKSLALHEQLGNRRGMASINSSIGVVYFDFGDYERAIEYYRRALAVHEETGEKNRIASTFLNLGMALLQMGDDVQALHYAQRALELSCSQGHKRLQAYGLLAIGEVKLKITQYADACRWLMQSLQLQRDELHSEELTAETLLNLARAELRSHDSEQALVHALEGLTIAERLNQSLMRYTICELLAEIAVARSDFESAFEHYKKFHEIKEQVQSDVARKKATLLEAERKSAEREKQQTAERAANEARVEAREQLLNRILPPGVSNRLLRGERVADYFQNISILFVDIVGFTPIAARMPAKAVLAFLNYVFGEFDKVMEKHNCQKIKTIGDGYMAVCGAPSFSEDHAERLARAAVELMHGIQLPEEIRKTLPKDSVFHLRMGLHTGSAFAGIVGEKGFVYDVYSDAVNLAARMESSGEPGKIHCSEEFAYHVQNRDESFVFEERGEIEVKGKGVMRTYFLERA